MFETGLVGLVETQLFFFFFLHIKSCEKNSIEKKKHVRRVSNIILEEYRTI